MARSGRSAQKGVRRSPKRLVLGVLIFGFAALIIAQSAPQISQFFNPVRASVGDRLGGGEQIGLWARLTGRAAQEQRIRELEAQVRDLSRYKAAAISMADRLEAYEEILNLLGEPPARGVTARVTSESEGPFAQTLLANAGRSQGVEPGSVAMNEGGLVGRVIQLGERSSRILLVTDFNSRVPVIGEVSGVHAIMQGGSTSSGTLTDLPERSDFIEGERILTSSEGGAYPRGLVVGDVQKSGNDWRVKYAMSDGSSGYVQLIPPPTVERPISAGDLPALEDGTSASPTQGARR